MRIRGLDPRPRTLDTPHENIRIQTPTHSVRAPLIPRQTRHLRRVRARPPVRHQRQFAPVKPVHEDLAACIAHREQLPVRAERYRRQRARAHPVDRADAPRRAVRQHGVHAQGGVRRADRGCGADGADGGWGAGQRELADFGAGEEGDDAVCLGDDDEGVGGAGEGVGLGGQFCAGPGEGGGADVGEAEGVVPADGEELRVGGVGGFARGRVRGGQAGDDIRVAFAIEGLRSAGCGVPFADAAVGGAGPEGGWGGGVR